MPGSVLEIVGNIVGTKVGNGPVGGPGVKSGATIGTV